ncbi:MAG: class I adenylate-forming enzyme family protein [Candidatus Longimicrobiales bacterium M2_2A_002]
MSLSVFAAAAEAPDGAALVADADTLTFAELADRVRPVVARLRAASLDGDDPVALIARRDLASLEAIHALMALGIPALLLHPRLTAPERARLIQAARPAGTLEPGENDDAPRSHRLPRSPQSPQSDPTVPLDDDRPLAIVHTSGTSGAPRGVILSRRAFAASAAASARNLGWRDDDRWLLPLPVAHVGGLSIVTRCLLARRAVVLAAGTDPETILEDVRRHRVTLLSLVPTQLARILALEPALAPPDHLRAVLLGGAAAPPALLRRAADRGWPVLTTYGLTEACSQATTQPCGTVNRGELGAGRPLPGIELRIGDDDVIQLRGPTLFSGYLPPGPEQPVTDPSSPFLPDGWFPTGDRGRLDDDGNLHVLGRRSDRIVSGGENVDPVEVERAIEELPGVARACVFGVPDPEWGEVVCAAVVPEQRTTGSRPLSGEPAATGDETAVLEALRAGVTGLRDVLAPFKLPRRVAVLDDLPLTPTGKVDRRETARQAAPRLRQL